MEVRGNSQWGTKYLIQTLTILGLVVWNRCLIINKEDFSPEESIFYLLIDKILQSTYKTKQQNQVENVNNCTHK